MGTVRRICFVIKRGLHVWKQWRSHEKHPSSIADYNIRMFNKYKHMQLYLYHTHPISKNTKWIKRRSISKEPGPPLLRPRGLLQTNHECSKKVMAFSALWRQASSPIPHKLQGLMTCHILKCAAKRWWRFVKSILSRNLIFLLFTGAHVLCVWHGLGRIMMGPNINEMGRPRYHGWIHAAHVLAFFVRYFLFDVLLSRVGIFFLIWRLWCYWYFPKNGSLECYYLWFS